VTAPKTFRKISRTGELNPNGIGLEKIGEVGVGAEQAERGEKAEKVDRERVEREGEVVL
jgi:hypothetical protein